MPARCELSEDLMGVHFMYHRNHEKNINFHPRSLIFVIFFLLFLPGVIIAQPFVPRTCTLLSVLTEDTHQNFPDINGVNVIWIDTSGKDSIHLYNIPSGEEITIQSGYVPTEGLGPAVNDRYIAWTTWTGFENAVILRDLFTGRDICIAGGNGTDAWEPDLDEGAIVWAGNHNGSYDIYYKNLVTENEMLLSPDTPDTDQSNPAISGDWVAWETLNPDTFMNDICLYSLQSGNVTFINPGSEYTDEKSPSIDGEYLVYQGMNYDTGLYDIYLYNISSGQTTLLTPDTAETNDEYPVIFNGKVVWQGQDPVDFSPELYLYDVGSNSTWLLERDISEADPGLPAIYQDRIVWQQPDLDTGYSDIYMITLGVDSLPLLADFSADTTTGESPITVNFTDTSSGSPLGWLWDFGDGISSTEQNPVHIYTTPGVFNVSLIINTPFQRSGKLASGYVYSGSPPTPDFSSDRYEGLAPLSVSFTDKSSGSPTTFHWDFGDGTSSSDRNPSHTFTSPGLYEVSLTAGNEFGNATTSGWNTITALSGVENDMLLDIPGISFISGTNPQQIILNSSLIQVNVINETSIEVLPSSKTGIGEIFFTSDNGFTWIDQSNISGTVTGVQIVSPSLSLSGCKNNSTLTYQLLSSTYPQNETFHTEIWVNVTPLDYEKFLIFSYLGNNSGICGVAFTAQFESANISGSPSGVLLFAIDSEWIEKVGWRRPVQVESDPEGAFVYVDGNCIGTTPLFLPSDLSGGNHNITLTRKGYNDEVRNVTLEEKHDSIRVIRIAEDGSGEILAAEFLYHDPLNNLDYFRAESPHGFSTFGVVSVSDAGNPIQIIFLALQELLPKLLAGAGGGGGHSLPPPASGNVPSPTTIATTNGVPTVIPTVTNIVTPVSTHPITEVVTPGLGEPEDTAPIQKNPGEVVPPIPFTLIQTIAIFFGAIFVISVLILRMQKGGGGS